MPSLKGEKPIEADHERPAKSQARRFQSGTQLSTSKTEALVSKVECEGKN
jgi:hypothetical protein